MKRTILICAVLAGATWLRAQSNEPIKLALIAESGTAAAAVDMLTVELSSHPALQLLERNEIQRVYREQGLSAENLDGLKLGRILGADGVMIISATQEASKSSPAPLFLPSRGAPREQPRSQRLETRLLAVKPGVILGCTRTVCLERELPAWAKGIAARFGPEFSKLGVLAKDAIPISVVNLRSATESAQGRETERQLTLLTIERLARERNLFVLERRRMELLGAEKDLKLDDSPFWKGGYLLEGVVDQEGYSANRVTLDARLVPPKGGTPIQIKSSASRTNLVEAVNQLAVELTRALNLTPTLKEWNADEEAGQYFQEAQWALRWGLFEQAQAAAESAWALGKRDLETATVRVKAWLVPPTYDVERRGSLTIRTTNPSRAEAARKPPDAASADRAQRALELFLEYSRSLDPGKVKTDSPWYRLGIEDLTVASRWLQHFYLVPQAQPSARASLERLRGSARALAEWLAGLPSSRAEYDVTDRLMSGDEVYKAYVESTNIFRCAVNWGCFWQERPEDTLVLYRELMRGALFCRIHGELWFRRANRPALVGWSAADEQRVPAVWNSFLAELAGSTNAFCQMEAKAFTFAALRAKPGTQLTVKDLRRMDANARQRAVAERDAALEGACDALFDYVCTNYDAIAAGNINLPRVGLGLDVFFNQSGMVTAATERLDRRYKTDYGPRLGAVQQARATRNDEQVKQEQARLAFERQKQFLMDFGFHSEKEFRSVFAFRDYTKAQVLELRPLLDAYCSNLVAQAAGKSQAEVFKARFDSRRIHFDVGTALDRALHPPFHAPQVVRDGPLSPSPSEGEKVAKAGEGLVQGAKPRAGSRNSPPITLPTRPAPQMPPPIALARQPTPPNSPAAPITPAADALLVSDPVTVPLARLGLTNTHGAAAITACRWSEHKLLLSLWYQAPLGRYSLASQSASAIFSPQTQSWDLIPHPRRDPGLTLGNLPGGLALGLRQNDAYSELFQGQLYLSDGGQIRRFDAQVRRWEDIEVPEIMDSQLFAFDGHLYAASPEIIFEILEGGKGTKILASTRRRPAVSQLDSLEKFGSLPTPPILFLGPNHSLCAAFDSRVVAWDGTDWHELFKLQFAKPPEASSEGVVFRTFSYSEPPSLWFLRNNQSQPELCVRDLARTGPGGLRRPMRSPGAARAHSLWRSSEDLSLTWAPVAVRAGSLLFYVEESSSFNGPGGFRPVPPGQSQPRLVCLLHGSPEPVVIPLRFTSGPGALPNSTTRQPQRLAFSTWMQFAGDSLFLSQGGFAGFYRIPLSEIQAVLARSHKSL